MVLDDLFVQKSQIVGQVWQVFLSKCFREQFKQKMMELFGQSYEQKIYQQLL